MSNAETYIKLLTDLYVDQGLYFSIHRKTTFADNEGTKIAFPGQAFQDYNKAVQSAFYWSKKGHDVYLAMGGEAEVGKSDKPKIYPPAIRKRYNVKASNCLYIDMDVKAGAYATHDDAMEALKGFIKHYRLPLPSIMVASGTGGIHAYWVASETFLPVEFNLMASGLAAMTQEYGLLTDPQCTNDICRLLRVPDTWNFKNDPPQPVELLYSGSRIPLFDLRSAIRVDNVVRLPSAGRVVGNTPHDDNDDLLAPGKQYAPVDVDQVANYCEFFHNTLMARGANLQGEPQWHAILALASHCTDGENTAHRLTSGHHHYNRDETTVKYYEAVETRKHNPSIGPPKCAYVKNLGATECNTCPYFTLNTTPLLVPQFSAPLKVVPSHDPNSDLPSGYYRGEDSTIWKEVANEEGDNIPVNVFPYPIMLNSAYAEGGVEYSFVFTTIEGTGHKKLVKVPMAATANKDALMASLSRSGLPMVMTNPMRDFIVAFATLLRNSDNTLVKNAPIGWTAMPDGTVGFSYDGLCYLPSGPIKAQRLGTELAKAYSVAGSASYWNDLSKMIIGQVRSDLDLVVASAFAAPLMALTGHFGVAIGIWSSQSGAGKSTVLALCQAVWGSTVRMQGLDDTVNQAVNTMASLRNMPVCWDEVKGKAQVEQMAKMVFAMSRGREKGRLNRASQQMEQQEFETMLIWTANDPLADEIARATRGTDAGQYRILEFCVVEKDSNLNVGVITSLVGELRHNHGHVGARYAEWLGRNHVLVKELVVKMRDKIDKDLRSTQAERFWTSAAACLVVGARLANMLKFTAFDLVTFEKFLYDKIKSFRKVLATGNTSNFAKREDVELLLGEFLHHMSLNTVKTDTVWKTTGRPTRGTIKVLNESLVFTRQTVFVQISEKERLCRISDPALGKWAKDQGITKTSLTLALEKHFSARAARGRIGSGTEYASPPILVWEVDLSNSNIGKEMEF